MYSTILILSQLKQWSDLAILGLGVAYLFRRNQLGHLKKENIFFCRNNHAYLLIGHQNY